jgi:CheY-like chemotaxis protein
MLGTLPVAAASDMVSSIAALVSAIAWPVVFVVVFLRFGPPLGRFLADHSDSFFSRLDKLSLEGAGVRVSAEAATVDLTNAAVKAARSEPDNAPVDVKEIAASVERAAEMTATRRPPEILWVDDRPGNNINERSALASLGMRCTLALSTDEALEKLRGSHFDVVISDMGRPPDPQAGYTLLAAMREGGDQTPFVIYAGSNAPEHKELARSHGALGSTNRPQELLDLVLRGVEASR